MKTRICTVCKTDKPLDQFNWKKKSENKRSNNCRDCQKIFKRNHYLNNKDYYYKKNLKQKQETKRLYDEYKATLSCEECGENHPWCIEFHHKNPKKKDFSIASAAHSCMNFSTILKEIAKCRVLCANCHRKLHYKLKNKTHSSNG